MSEPAEIKMYSIHFQNNKTASSKTIYRNQTGDKIPIANLTCQQISSFIKSCRQHRYPWPSLATSPYHSSLFGRSSGLHPVSSHSCCMYVRAGRPAFAWPYAGVHGSTSLMSSSLLLQQCPACLVRLTCIVFVMGGKWSYSWWPVGCWRQDLPTDILIIILIIQKMEFILWLLKMLMLIFPCWLDRPEKHVTTSCWSIILLM